MSRPHPEHPTPAELEILKVLWERGPSTPRDVLESLEDGKDRAYTTVASLLNVMLQKELVTREQRGRAFLYAAGADRESTLSGFAHDLVKRVFEGSVSSLVAHVLDQGSVSAKELEAIRKLLRSHRASE